MGLKEILKHMGFTDEQIQSVMDGLTENKLYISSVKNPEETIRQLQGDVSRLEGENRKLQETKNTDSGAAEEVKKLLAEVDRAKINTSVLMALSKEKAADVEYLMYLAEKGGMKGVKIGEDGSVSGVEELVAGLKKDHAAQFADGADAGSGGSMKRVGVKKLDDAAATAEDTPQTLEEAIARKYSGDEE